MEFTFESRGGSITLPVNPEDLTVKYSSSNKTSDVIGIGEINTPRTRKLQTIRISSILPADTSVPYASGSEEAQDVLEFFGNALENKETVKVVISGSVVDLMLNGSRRMTIEKFEPSIRGGTDDATYTLDLKEYRNFEAKTVPLISAPTTSLAQTTMPSSNRPDDSGEITIGSTVIANGRVHLDSFGSSPGKSLSNYEGKCNLINKSGSHPYHVTTPSGGYLGWMTSGSVRKK